MPLNGSLFFSFKYHHRYVLFMQLELLYRLFRFNEWLLYRLFRFKEFPRLLEFGERAACLLEFLSPPTALAFQHHFERQTNWGRTVN